MKTVLLLLCAVALCAGCAPTDAKRPQKPELTDVWNQDPKVFWYEETMFVQVTPLSKPEAEKQKFKAEFILKRQWIPSRGEFSAAHPTLSDQVVLEKTVTRDELWKTSIPMANGEFEGHLRVLSRGGFYLEAKFWRPDESGNPALDWEKQFTPPLKAEIPLVVVTRKEALSATAKSSKH